MDELPIRVERRLPSNDPMWIASRFAWLSATLDGVGAIFVTLLAAFGAVPWLAALPSYATASAMGYLATRIKAGDLRAAKLGAGLAYLEAALTLATMALVARRNPLMLIMTALPVGIRIVLALQIGKPTRARPS